MKRKTPRICLSGGEYNAMRLSLGIIGRKCNCRVEVTPHRTPHVCRLAILKGMPLETLQKVLGHKSILSTQVYAELINPKVGEDTDRICEKIGHVYKLAM